MIRVYDYLCQFGHRHELFVSSEDHGPQPCKTCGQAAERQLSAPPFILEGHSGAFPSRASKWEREHESAGRSPKH